MDKVETVAYLGPQGTFNHEAAAGYKRVGPETKLIPCDDIGPVFKVVAEGKAQIGIVPYKNIIGGGVVPTLDLLLKWNGDANITISDSIMKSILMAIGGNVPREQVEVIASHEKALSQCRGYLDKNFPDAKRVPVESTAKGIELLLNDYNYARAAALASPLAFSNRGVPIYEEGVADLKHNKTRFLVIQKGNRSTAPTTKDMTTIAVVPVNPVHNFSAELLNFMKEYEIIPSDHHLRPTGRDMDVNYFDLPGHMKGQNRLEECVKAIETELPFRGRVKVHHLGSYHAEDFFPSVIHNIGIIGASRGRGNILKKFFEAAGYKVNLTESHRDFKKEQPKQPQRPRREGDTVIIAREEKKMTGSPEYVDEVKKCAMASDVIVLNVYRKSREEIVRAIAEHVYSGNLIVVNSNKLKGEEERVRRWIEDETGKIISPLVGAYRVGREDAKTGTEKFVRKWHSRYQGTDEDVTAELVKEHCKGIEILGMDALITDSFPTLKGQTVVFTPSSPLEELTKPKEFIDTFHKHGVDVVTTDAQTHDELTGRARIIANQLSHVAARTLIPLGGFDDVMKYSTPDTRLLYALMIKQLSGDIEADVATLFDHEKRNELLKRIGNAQAEVESNSGNPLHYEIMAKQNAGRVRGKDPSRAFDMVRKARRALME